MRRLAGVIGLLACAAAPDRTPAWERQAASLGGQWEARFRSMKGDTSTGAVDLIVNRTVDRRYDRIGLPTNYGTYAIRFQGLGGSPSGSRVPAVVAGFVGADSVYMVFETDREAFAMGMRGRLAGDSITGTWSASQSRGTIASGTFSMIRSR